MSICITLCCYHSYASNQNVSSFATPQMLSGNGNNLVTIARSDGLDKWREVNFHFSCCHRETPKEMFLSTDYW
jgi:hypothetical protein